MKRYCEPFIQTDLLRKMAFVGGPRQVGKTTLCKQIGENYDTKPIYLNWDVSEDRKIIIQKLWPKHHALVIFDELHKYGRWKQWIKGVYDAKEMDQQYLVTGSARLDTYKRGGDSLLGRYHYWRLHPLTIDELPDGLEPELGLSRLLTLGGFPEPFLKNDEREARRWRKERFARVTNEDIRDLQIIRDISSLQLYIDALRDRAGQLVTLANLAGEIQISPTTAKNWLLLIEKMYLAFSIYPLTKNVPRSIAKPPKVYFYDNADTRNDYAVRLENLVATTLLKRLHFLEDYYGYDCQLHYIRDKEGREVDFLTVIDGVPTDLIEVKSQKTDIPSALKYYSERLKPKRTVMIVGNLLKSFEKNGVLVTNPIEFFKDPPWRL